MVASFVGWLIVAFGTLGAVAMLYIKLYTSRAVPGITAIIVIVIILGGIQIIMLGVIGEYVGRIFKEAKGRPLYVIAEKKNIPSLVEPTNVFIAKHQS